MLHEIIKTVSHSAVDYFNDEKRDNFNDGKRMEVNVGNICLVWEGPFAKAQLCICERDPYGNPDVNNGEWMDVSGYLVGDKRPHNWFGRLVSDMAYNVAMLIDVDEDERQAMLDELEYRQQYLDDYDWYYDYKLPEGD